MKSSLYLPAEWEKQSGIQLTWPHSGTDWAHMLKEVQACFIEIAYEIAKQELLLIVAPNIDEVKSQIGQKVNMNNVRFIECETNDTWARDHGAITIIENGVPKLLDFKFNGWGLKFASNYDNLITTECYKQNVFEADYENRLNFVLEGGSIESDGKGTLLTTSRCLLSPNRNGEWRKQQIESYLKKSFGLQQILWLDYGYLAGDDTDSHIDTLARMCPNDTILYVKCTDENDEHYKELCKMEEQLKSFRTPEGHPYRLIPLPMADTYWFDSERLPATYANFLILNNVILYPTYNQPKNHLKAASVLQEAFPEYKITGIDCQALIKQHGSLHCVTMQYPEKVIKHDKPCQK